MPKITAYNLVRAIKHLPRNVNYNYINPATKGIIHVEDVVLPAGPIHIKDGLLLRAKRRREQKLRVYRRK